MMRLGFYGSSVAQKLKDKETVWFHAASVGEVKAILPLIKKFRDSAPRFHVVLTTVTRTGHRIAQESIGEEGTVLYFPLDFCFSVFRAVRVIHPVMVVLIESEIWPNFLYRIQRKKIPIALINVRMSMRSYRRYRRASFFMKRFVQLLSLVTTPTTREAAKMVLLGAPSHRIHVVGNLKFESHHFVEPTQDEKSKLMESLGFPHSPDVMTILAGSTHEGEEEILTHIYKELLDEFPNLYLILVPRHPERAAEVAEMIDKKKLSYQLKTKMPSQAPHRILIVDTIGDLERLYSIADIVFIGKSLTRRGGQNFLEPARCGKPIIFGPHMENFEDMVDTFVEEVGALQIQNPNDLKQNLIRLLLSRKERELLGRRAKEILLSNQGALDSTLELLGKLLKTATNADY